MTNKLIAEQLYIGQVYLKSDSQVKRKQTKYLTKYSLNRTKLKL